jgi:hypothetical protein
MKKLTVSGDASTNSERRDAFAEIPLQRWAEAVTRGTNQFEVNPLYFGQAVRTDVWSCCSLARPWHTMYLVLEGEVPTRVSGDSFLLKPGTLFWLMPGAAHDMQWPARFVFTEIWFRLRDGECDLRLPKR